MRASTTIPRILVASLVSGPYPVPQKGVQTVETALACLSEATAGRCDMVLVHGGVNDPLARRSLIELVDCLRQHPASRKTPVLVTLERWHRAVLVELKRVGLELVDVRGPGGRIAPLERYALVARERLRFDIDQALARLCPHLNYTVFEGGTELVTCGACHDRMVLGGERLRSVCQTPGHGHCAYFQKPKERS